MAGHLLAPWLLAPLLLAPLLLLLAIAGISATPQEDQEARLLQYREAAMDSEGCSFWKDVMRLHYKVLLGLDRGQLWLLSSSSTRATARRGSWGPCRRRTTSRWQELHGS